jgi:hypothetical protein
VKWFTPCHAFCASNDGKDLPLFARHRTDKEIGVGVVDHCITTVEPAEHVAGLTGDALECIPPERLVITTDCGFGREGLSRRIAYYKCVALVEGTNIVRRELGLPEAPIRAADPRLCPARKLTVMAQEALGQSRLTFTLSDRDVEELLAERGLDPFPRRMLGISQRSLPTNRCHRDRCACGTTAPWDQRADRRCRGRPDARPDESSPGSNPEIPAEPMVRRLSPGEMDSNLRFPNRSAPVFETAVPSASST